MSNCLLSLHPSFIAVSLPEGSLLVGRGHGVVLVDGAAAFLAPAPLRLRPVAVALIDALRGQVEALPVHTLDRLRHATKLRHLQACKHPVSNIA